MATLDNLITTLQQMPRGADLVVDCYDGPPGDLASYRGYYDQLAIEPGGDPMTVGEFLLEAVATVGATFTGYKGGDYVMEGHTKVWVSPYGEAREYAFVGVLYDVVSNRVRIITQYEG